MYVEIVKTVKAGKIPVALKVSPYLPLSEIFALKMSDYGVDGLVLFNRFVQPDIDITALSTED